MIAGDGVCIDAVRGDFASGAIEGEVLRHGSHHDILWVEGQGSLVNPASTATLPLIRGSQPTDLILVRRAGMPHLKNYPEIKVPPLADVVRLYENVASTAGTFEQSRVVGVALNGRGCDAPFMARYKAELKAELGLPCIDPVADGVAAILDPLLELAGLAVKS